MLGDIEVKQAGKLVVLVMEDTLVFCGGVARMAAGNREGICI